MPAGHSYDVWPSQKMPLKVSPLVVDICTVWLTSVPEAAKNK